MDELFKSRSGEMADAADSKSAVREYVWVRLPPPAPFGEMAELG